MRKFSGIIVIERRYLKAAGLILLGMAAYGGGGRLAAWTETWKSATGQNISMEVDAFEDKAPGGDGQTAAADFEAESQALQEETEAGTDYIKWVEFHVTKEALQQAYEYDVASHESEYPLDWVELLAYLGAKYGGDFTRYDPEDMTAAAEKLRCGELTMEQLAGDMQYYPYYLEAYGAVLGGMVGEYQIEDTNHPGEWITEYGLKAFHPIAKGFPYTDYDDFGVSRTYGYKRNHLGHDMMGQVGTPIVAVESGYVYVMGWNQYGGWRIGINSFDGKRYYYYAHLRQNAPFAAGLQEGSIVQAGDVIGYMGRTGYSTTENVNNIDISHLHFGLQLIFDESQREGTNQIWIDTYQLIRFLYQKQSETVRDDTTKEWSRVTQSKDLAGAQEQR